MKKRKTLENVNQLKVGSILTYINLFISCIIPLLYTPVMLRILGQEEYGLYSLSNSVVGYLALLTFGMGSAVNRYVTKYRIEKDQQKLESAIGLFLFLYLIMAMLVCIAGGVLTNYSGVFFGEGLSDAEIGKLKILMGIMTLSTAISFPVSVYSTITISYEKYIFRKLMESIGTIMAPVLNLVALFCGYASIGMACVALISQIVYLIVYAQYSSRKLHVHPSFRKMPFYMLYEIGGFSAFIFLSSMVDMLYWATDKILLGAMVGTAAVAVYNIGGTFTSMLQNMSSAISGVFGTRVTTMVLSKQPMDELSKLLVRIGRLQYLVVSFILSGYIVFGKTFIYFWAGDAYKEAYYIGLITMVPLAIPLIQSIAFATIVAQNKHRFRAVIYAVIAVLNVISTYLVIPHYGIIGAAACSGIAFVVGNGIIMNIYYLKVTKLNIKLFWSNILRMSIVPAVCCVIGGIFVNFVSPAQTLMVFLAYVILFSVVFLLFTWLYSMNEYEKDILKGMLKRVRHKNNR